MWWTKGENPRDDIFWRTSQSGGRATTRAKKGKTTAFSHGDIAAVDPIGQPFLNKFTVELKRGNSHGTVADLLDANGATELPIQRTIWQAIRSRNYAGSEGWMVVHKRDRKPPLIYVSATAFIFVMGEIPPNKLRYAKFRLPKPGFLQDGTEFAPEQLTFFVCSLSSFFKAVDPYAEFWGRTDLRAA